MTVNKEKLKAAANVEVDHVPFIRDTNVRDTFPFHATASFFGLTAHANAVTWNEAKEAVLDNLANLIESVADGIKEVTS